MSTSTPPDPLAPYIDSARELEPVSDQATRQMWNSISEQLNAVDVSLLAGAAASTTPGAEVGLAGLKSYLLAGLVGLTVGGAIALPVGYQWGRSTTKRPAMASAPIRLERPPEATSEPSAGPPSPPPPPAPERSKTVPPKTVAIAPPETSPAPTPAPAEISKALEQERQLLERMRHALLQRRLDAVDEAIAEHERNFAAGQLAEEREAMRVQRWVLGDNPALAGRHLETFRTRFPDSRLLPVLSEQVKSLEPR